MSPFITCTRRDNTRLEGVGVVISNTDMKVIKDYRTSIVDIASYLYICLKDTNIYISWFKI